MADNTTLPGTGDVIGTDDVGGVKYQQMKLVTSELNSAEGIGDDDKGSQRSLWVTPRPNLVLPNTPVNSSGLTTATTAYAIGDTLGAGWTIPNAARASGGMGYIEKIVLYDLADVTGIVTLWFAESSITFGTDNAAPSISDTDIQTLCGKEVLYMEDLGGARVGIVDGLAIAYTLNATTSLSVYATTGTAHTFFAAATDLRLKVGVVPI